MSEPTGMLAPHDAHQWTRRDATHLLWRAQFGATVSEIDRAHKESLSKNLFEHQIDNVLIAIL